VEALEQGCEQWSVAGIALGAEAAQRAAQDARSGICPFRISAEPEKIVCQARRQIVARAADFHSLGGCVKQGDFLDGCFRGHPGILAHAAPLEGNGLSLGARRDARQTAGHDAVVLAIGHQINAQGGGAGNDGIPVPTRSGRKFDALLGYEQIGIEFDVLSQSIAFGRGRDRG